MCDLLFLFIFDRVSGIFLQAISDFMSLVQGVLQLSPNDPHDPGRTWWSDGRIEFVLLINSFYKPAGCFGEMQEKNPILSQHPKQAKKFKL